MTDAPALVADLGATNARFALIGPAGVERLLILRVADYPTLAAAIGAYLDRVEPAQPPRRAALAIASPIVGDRVAMTNHAWSFSISELRAQLALDQLEVVNDFAAVALACPALDADDLRQVGPGQAVAGQTIGVIGAGTGLGAAGLVPAGAGWSVLAGEGGHATMPAVNEREAELLRRLRLRYSHVSAERVLSGAGIVNIYETLAAIDGQDDAPTREPHQVTEAALGGLDPLCLEATEMFCAMLGTVTGNLALTLGARGGIYVAGGIVPKLGDFFDRSAFRERFEAKGRFRAYLQAIPTFVVTHPLPALIGLRAVLARGNGESPPGPHF